MDTSSRTANAKIDILKGLSILSVICAHCNTVSDTASRANQAAHFLLSALGTIGVGVFFAVAGWSFMRYTDKTTGAAAFLRKKAKRLFLPWLICGTAVYMYVVLRKGGLSFLSWVKFLLGIGSYLYFVPVLFALYVVGYYSYRSNVALYFFMLLSVVSNLLTSRAFPDTTYAYINIANWMLYFSIGIRLGKTEMRRYSWIDKLSVLVALLTLLMCAIRGFSLSYWTPWFILFELFASVALLYIAEQMSRKNGRLAKWIARSGRESMTIFLLHMPVAGIVANICGRLDFWWLTLLRPIIVFAITFAAIELYQKIATRWNMKFLLEIIGLC